MPFGLSVAAIYIPSNQHSTHSQEATLLWSSWGSLVGFLALGFFGVFLLIHFLAMPVVNTRPVLWTVWVDRASHILCEVPNEGEGEQGQCPNLCHRGIVQAPPEEAAAPEG